MIVGAVTTLDVKLFHISTVLCVNEYFDLNITRLYEELTEEASCGDLQSEEDL
jgi:hypothetical protein